MTILRRFVKPVLYAVGVLLFIGVLYLIFHTDRIPVTVSGHRWRREIQIEDYQPRNQSAWDEAVPRDAYNSRCHNEIRSTSMTCDSKGRNCTTHHRYDNKCSFTVNRWQYRRSLVTSGILREDTPYWPVLDFSTCDELGCEREGRHIEVYTLLFESTTSTYSCNLAQDIWAGFLVGDLAELDIFTLGNRPKCETLVEAN